MNINNTGIVLVAFDSGPKRFVDAATQRVDHLRRLGFKCPIHLITNYSIETDAHVHTVDLNTFIDAWNVKGLPTSLRQWIWNDKHVQPGRFEKNPDYSPAKLAKLESISWVHRNFSYDNIVLLDVDSIPVDHMMEVLENSEADIGGVLGFAIASDVYNVKPSIIRSLAGCTGNAMSAYRHMDWLHGGLLMLKRQFVPDFISACKRAKEVCTNEKIFFTDEAVINIGLNLSGLYERVSGGSLSDMARKKFAKYKCWRQLYGVLPAVKHGDLIGGQLKRDGRSLIPRVICSVTNSEYFKGAWALLNSIYAYHETSITTFVFTYKLNTDQMRELRLHPLRVRIINTDSQPLHIGMWEHKQQMLAYLLDYASCVYLLDADLVLTSPVDDVFVLAEKGRIVASRDGVQAVTYGEDHRSYGDAIIGKHFDYFNSGAICLNVVKHWDLVGLWAFAAKYGSYSPNGGWPLALRGHGDQGLLNALAVLLNKEKYIYLLDQDEWCDSANRVRPIIMAKEGDRLMVTCDRTGRRQRLIHNTGSKWWTSTGRDEGGNMGDKLKCFEHFYNMKVL